MTNDLFLQKLASSGQVNTADISKLVQDYRELEVSRKVVDAAKDLLEFLPSGDLFGAGKYSSHNIAIYELRKSLKELDGEK